MSRTSRGGRRKRAAAPGKEAPPNSRTLTLANGEQVSRDRTIAMVATSASATAATVSVEYSRATFGELSLTDTMAVLSETVQGVRKGNLGEVEGLLIAQAVALNSIFTDLSLRAARAEYVDTMECYLRLGLRAQGQCRATLETLAAIKNPPLVVARQANIANGPQQVNNGPAAPLEPPRAEESKAEQNKLLEARHSERMDTREASTTAASDPALATVGEIDRPTND